MRAGFAALMGDAAAQTGPGVSMVGQKFPRFPGGTERRVLIGQMFDSALGIFLEAKISLALRRGPPKSAAVSCPSRTGRFAGPYGPLNRQIP